ncbi:MAG: HAD family hydrolase [Pontibacterium sp.]
MTLAIFDLDNTLIGGDSDHSWGVFLCEIGAVDADEYSRENDRFYDDYLNGTLDIVEYQRFVLSPLALKTKAELETLHNRFMDEVISKIMLPKAAELLEQHRKAGHTLVLITATNRFVIEPIAHALGFEPANIMATEPQRDEAGNYTGDIEGIPCFQDGKVQRLAQWLKEHNASLEGSYFYSDSHNDLPLLEQVDNPVAVNPDETLLAHAENNLWPVLDLR